MGTIRTWLEASGFDWKSGKVLIQKTSGYSPGWSGEDEIVSTKFVAEADPILGKEFDEGYGAPRCPRFWAKDKVAIFFPSQYDGATGIEKVYLKPDKYLAGELTPYPGG